MIALALTLALQAQPYPADADCGAANTTFEMADCARRQGQVWDTRLNQQYQATMKRFPAARQVKLRAAQRLWISYRLANCQVYAAHEGTIATVLSAQCWRDMTRDRTLELKSLD